MKFLAAVVALAAVAVAAPADVEPRTASRCNAVGQRQVCCGGLLGCLVQVLGSTCSTRAYCCETGASTGGLVNVNALNCLSLG
ncbi:hypothetical protein XA68_14673 [Ophiocordyceps unilateralis]|uniref:Hydrophobin 3 n=1 Tax=Ophiocordyceps unilateralis TaxID=268505 RepID=A0A2A9PA27_OPHUN|nr:hypothetical protein XA68_14673 [Ophiocordyceps unilateralis]